MRRADNVSASKEAVAGDTRREVGIALFSAPRPRPASITRAEKAAAPALITASCRRARATRPNRKRLHSESRRAARRRRSDTGTAGIIIDGAPVAARRQLSGGMGIGAHVAKMRVCEQSSMAPTPSAAA